MEIRQLLTIYDQEQRRDVVYPSEERQVLPSVVRHVGIFNQVLYTELDENNADAVIREQIAYFAEREFEWKYFTHDTPPDLLERLTKHGFAIGEAEAILILDLESAPESLFAPVKHDVRRITDPADIPGIMTVQSQVFSDRNSSEDDPHVRQLTDELRSAPDQLSIYAVYTDAGAVASSAWVRLPANNRFASLWGAATLPQYRNRGFYTALMAIRIQEARARGRRFVTVDASPMSRPILSKFGFQWITTSHPCQWRGESAR